MKKKKQTNGFEGKLHALLLVERSSINKPDIRVFAAVDFFSPSRNRLLLDVGSYSERIFLLMKTLI